jgi:UDP-N-acetylmuramate dehydrogenase
MHMLDVEKRIARDEPLKHHTSFKVGGPARYFFEADSVESLKEVVRYCHERAMPWTVIGGGTNLLVSDAGYDGCIIKLAGLLGAVTTRPGGLSAGAGASVAALVSTAAEEGLGGAECLVGIPGTVGGALAMNAGGAYGCIGDFVSSVHCMTASLEGMHFPREQIGFGYRSSSLGEHVILTADFALRKADAGQVREKMRAILKKRLATQPMGEPSAGCIFKNPPGDFAGRLIEEAGLKGAAVGAASVSEKHANYIINDGGATADDILALIHLIQEKVKDTFGVALELEIRILK